ncbi:thioredoxin family protein [Fibrella forsythiae]|uniref:Thioredoxin family protein n=1 Tax=Fibrella forsythiae TaxID=2817061 RepID=A0ABS3JQ02_9BACT|nr:thioredoxin family protein [Fibrella forsythiae]MBO0952068.1 thioredoxin family protein [Fibrella forsythiae]
MKSFLLAFLLGVSLVPALAQRPASGYTLGDVAASFALTNVDNRTISLTDYKNQKGVIVVFTSNHCPFSKAYEDRIMALDSKFGPQGFPVVAILSSDASLYEEDSFDRMQVRARTKNYTFPYLLDASQAVAKAFGAIRTPQVYVLKHSGERFTVEYIGSIDDSPQDASHVQRAYVDEAVTSLLAGKPVVTPLTKAIGCAIKMK